VLGPAAFEADRRGHGLEGGRTMGGRKGVDGSSMEQRDWARGCLGVVIGAEDGRGWAGVEISDTQVGSAIREVEMRMVEEESARWGSCGRGACDENVRLSQLRCQEFGK
jgi:hypothetical protein